MADESSVAELPAGTVTFLFTDIEGSTQLLERHPHQMGAALARHHEIFEKLVAANHGVILETVGDAVYAAFSRASDGLVAAVAVQTALAEQDWEPIGAMRVRMGIHTGDVERRGDHYFGPALFRCARLMATGYGEQVLVSAATARLVLDALPPGVTLRDLGTHRLKDLGEAERVYMLGHADLPAEFPPLRSIDARPNNLPMQLTSFVGREAELDALTALLAKARLVTLLGPGGMGKTRLALQVAADLLDAFPDGTFFVDLSSARSPEVVVPAIATTLGLRDIPGRSIAEVLAGHLASREMLLVLDNFEQVVEAASELPPLLQGAAGLRLLVTSRVALRLSAEQRYELTPMETSSAGNEARAAGMPIAPAVQLFVQRARQADPRFALTDEHRATVTELCRRLDGMPLAIELAAARSGLLSPAAMLGHLERGGGALGGSPRDRPERHETLDVALRWSEDLLSDAGRQAFHQLGVFAGGFSLEGAEAVVEIRDGEALDTLEELSDASLIRRLPVEELRFGMYETIRSHALRRLTGGGQVEQVRRRHAEWLRTVVQVRDMYGETSEEIELVGREIDNVRAATAWALDHDPALAAELLVCAEIYWRSVGSFREGREWLGIALERYVDQTALRARALLASGQKAFLVGEYEQGRERLAAARTLARRTADPRTEFVALVDLASLESERGNYAAAVRLARDAVELAHGLRDSWPAAMPWASGRWGYIAWQIGEIEPAARMLSQAWAATEEVQLRSWVGGLLSMVSLSRGDVRLAGVQSRDAVSLARASGFVEEVAFVLGILGLCLRAEGDLAGAESTLRESVQILAQVGDQYRGPSGLEALAQVMAERGDASAAARAIGTAQATRARFGTARPPVEQADFEATMSAIRRDLSSDALEAAIASGRSTTFEALVADLSRSHEAESSATD